MYRVQDATPRYLLQRSESCRRDEKKKVKLKRKSLSFRMSEGRKSQVILLDDRRLDLLVQPKLYSTELLDIVASHFNLKEKEYFGLSFKDETGHHHWLHLDRKVLEHDFPKKTGPMVLYFGVRFFIESIGYLRDNATIELFFLQAKQAIFKGHIEVDSETSFELAAHVLQASIGDYTDDLSARKQLKKLPVLPTSVLREHPNLDFCEEQVLAHYRKLEGHTRGSAIVNYMTIIESIPTYGIHYYEVKDKSGIPWWLGLSHKGISLYDYTDKRVPRRVFAWKQLENLYFRDRKFSIEVHDPKRIVHTLSSFNLYEDAIQEPLDEFDELSDAISDPTTQVSVSRRTFGPGNVNVHAWLACTPQLTKCIWSMAVSQHQFYLDRKQSKSQLPQVRSMSEIASDLCHSSTSLQSSAANSADGISRSNSAHSLTLSTYNSRTELTAEDIQSSREAHRDMYLALKARKDALEEALRKKTEELKSICLKEAEVTGVLPQETPLAPGEPLPQIRRRVGTAFALSPKNVNRDKATEAEEALGQLELDLELQDKITKAAHRLAQDKSVAKSVRKQRKQQYHKSRQKLKDIEKRLNEYRECIGKIPVKKQTSLEDLSEDSREFLDSEPEFVSPLGSPSMHRHDGREVGKGRFSNNHYTSPTTPQMKIITSPKVEVVELDSPMTPSRSSRYLTPHYQSSYSSLTPSPHALPPQGHFHHHGNRGQAPGAPQHKSAPASPVRQPHGAPRVSTPSPKPGRHHPGNHGSNGGGGYIPNSVYSTRNTYRNQMYPTYSTKDAPALSGSHSDYENSSRPSNRHVSRIDRENHRNENVNNLYNVNTNRMASYDSTDELKSPASEDYDSYSSDQEPMGGRWHGYQGREDGESHPRGYGSLDRNKGTNLMMAELSPSKFGSKRESHSDYRDSPYQPIEMPPLPRNVSDLREVPSNGYRQMPYNQGNPEDVGHSQDDTSSHNTSIPYIDCSQNSITVPGGAQWYDPKANSQHHPQYESPPLTYIRPDGQPYNPNPGMYEHGQPKHSSDSNFQSPPNSATVTKYQSYVEVSKPFEMSDFYKYSERLRKQRVHESPPSSTGEGSAAPSPHHLPPQQSSYPASGRPASHHHQSQGSGRGYAPPPRQAQSAAHSGVSGYSSSSSLSRSRPSSPFSQHGYHSGSEAAVYSKSSQYAESAAPLPGGAQSNLVQTAYHHHHGSAAYQPTHQNSPKHIPYQPPKAMTCEPVRDSPAHSSASSSSHRRRRRSGRENRDASFGSMDVDSGVAEAFSEEMLAWYDNKDGAPRGHRVGKHRTNFI